MISHKRLLMCLLCQAKPCNMSNWVLSRDKDKDKNHTERARTDLRLNEDFWIFNHLFEKKIDREQIKAKRYMGESGEGSHQRSLLWSIVLKPQLPVRTKNSLFPWWMNFIWLSAIYSAGCSTLCKGEWSVPSIRAECNWLCRLRVYRNRRRLR